MKNLTPEQATMLLELTLPALKREHQITKNIIEAIPDGKGDYRPEANCMTALELAWHIVSAETRFLDAVASGEFNFSNNAKPESIRTPTDVANWYAERFAAGFDRLTRLSPEQLAKTIDFRGILQLSAVMFLEIGLKHSVHHRGQLTVYLRPMGAKVPSIYGESYDDRQARMAAQTAS